MQVYARYEVMMNYKDTGDNTVDSVTDTVI